LPKLDKNPFNSDLKYNKRIHLMNGMVPGIRVNKLDDVIENSGEDNDEEKDEEKDEGKDEGIEGKMSASNEKTKIDLLETPKNIKKKIGAAYCLEGNVDDNSILIILDKVIFRILEHLDKPFIIERNEEYGGNKEYNNIDQVTNDFLKLKLHPGDLKNGISKFLSLFLAPIREAFSTKDMINLINKSYN